MGTSGRQTQNEYFTPVNLVFVLINLIVFFVLSAKGDTTNAEFMYHHGAMFPHSVIYGHEYYRLFTSAFLHFDTSHLLNNLIMLFFLGSYLEHAIGKFRYIIFYVLACIGSSMVSTGWMIHTGSYAVSGGASGAIFGIIGGLLAILVKNRGHYRGIAIQRLLLMIALSIFYGFSTAGVDNAEHVGGLIVGFVLGLLLYWKKLAPQTVS